MDSTTESNSTVNSTETMNSLESTSAYRSIEKGKRLLGHLLAPIEVKDFMDKYWTKQPISVNRESSDFIKNLISFETIKKMLIENNVDFTKNIEVKFYDENRTIAQSGRVTNYSFWNYYNEASGIRISNLEEFMPLIYEMNATLQEFFQTRVTSNVYLSSKTGGRYTTGPDDNEKFILQIAGKNRWRLKYINGEDHSEHNTELEAGGLLYIPHGASLTSISTTDQSSHLTLCVDRIPTYGDLIGALISTALDKAINDNVRLRQGISADIWNCMGTAYIDYNNPQRTPTIEQIRNCLDTLDPYANKDSIDEAVDQLALRYQCIALPPKLSVNEELCSVYGTKVTVDESGDTKCFTIDLYSKIRLIRENVVRLVQQDSEYRLYYSSQNTKELNDSPIDFNRNYIQVSMFESYALQKLITKYPLFVTLRDLHSQVCGLLLQSENILPMAQELWMRGIVITDKPLL